MTFSLTACSKDNTEELSNIYSDLQEQYDAIDVLAGDLYSSWHYGIYEDDHSKTSLSYEISLSTSDLTGGACDLLFFDDWNYTVLCVTSSHEELGSYEAAREQLNSIKNKIKAIDSKDEDEMELIEVLEDYYAALVNFLDLAEDYDGSFNSLQDDIADCRNDVKDAESTLDFDLG